MKYPVESYSTLKNSLDINKKSLPKGFETIAFLLIVFH